MKETLEQKVIRLEKELKAYRSETTIAQAYISLKSYVDKNNILLGTIEVTAFKMGDKDDKLFERSNKYSNEITSHIKDLQELEKMVTSEVMEEEKKVYGNILEEAIAKREE